MEKPVASPDHELAPSLGRRLAEVAWAFLPLGWIAFGGPQAHIALLQERFVARRRWLDDDPDKRFAWYMPIREAEPLRRAVHYVLSRPGLFLNTTSDATLLPALFSAASQTITAPTDADMAEDQAQLGIEPLFVRDLTDEVRPAAN